MPRPPKCRIISKEPAVTYFKPRGVPMRNLPEISLPFEGLEAIRLADVIGLDQDAASTSMGVSRQTFGRILSEARRTIASAIVNGHALRIEGGHYQLAERDSDARD